jgi:hypothetical protein
MMKNSSALLQIKKSLSSRLHSCNTTDGNPVVKNGELVTTRIYNFEKYGADIQEHSAGHYYGEGNPGNQGPHFNVRPQGTYNDSFPGTFDHYGW